MRQPTALERNQIRERLIQKIRDACPTDEQCNEAGQACFDLHPIHPAVRTGGVITMIDARVDGLVDLIMEEVYPGAQQAPPREAD